MRVTADPEYARDLIRRAAKRHADTYYEERDLIHVSELLVCVTKAFYARTIKLSDSEQASEDLTLMLGSAFHAWLQWEDEVPIRLDGIIGRPDIRELDATEVEVSTEIKSTRSSANKPLTGPDGMGYYFDQVASYTKMLAVQRGLNLPVYHARLTILHMMGDYRDNRKPILNSWAIEFTAEELDQWKDTLYGRAAILRESLESGRPPATMYRQKWACSYCPFYKKLCNPTDRPAFRDNFILEQEPETDLDYAPEEPITT